MTTVELWCPVIGWEGFYEVSDWGRVRGLHPGPKRYKHILAGGVNHKGYRLVSLRIGDRTGGYSVHRLVLEAFVGPMPEAMETRHLDGSNLGPSRPLLRPVPPRGRMGPGHHCE